MKKWLVGVILLFQIGSFAMNDLISQEEGNTKSGSFTLEKGGSRSGISASEVQKKELQTCLRTIFVNNSLQPEKMKICGANIDRIWDIFEKRKVVEKMYKKFQLFSKLYGRTELGVTATQKDLSNILKYLKNTEITFPISVSRSYFPESDTFVAFGSTASPFADKISMGKQFNALRDAESRRLYEDEVNRAKTVKFPSEAFDRLAEQFNVFVDDYLGY